MTDAKIDKALALAIGYLPRHIRSSKRGVMVYRPVIVSKDDYEWCWYVFDHRNWATIAPIAEKYDCFPYKAVGGWLAGHRDCEFGDTPQKAIALAVIGGAKT